MSEKVNYMRTLVTIKQNVRQVSMKRGERGYIDGYVMGGNDTPLAVVVHGEKIELIPLHALKVINNYKGAKQPFIKPFQ